MKARSLTSRILIVLGATLALMLSAGLAWAAVNDYQVHGLVPKGVTLAGHDLSGMTEAQVRAAIDAAVSAPMLQPVTVTGDKKTWTLDPKNFVTIDTEGMVSEAYSTRRDATFVTRVDSELRGTPLPKDVKPLYSVDATAVGAWIAQAAAKVDRRPVDSTRTIAAGYKFKITPAVYGARVSQTASVQRIVNALSADAALAGASRVVTLSVIPKTPKVLPSSYKTAIIVSLNQCRIYLYNGAKLVKSYSCAPGRPGYPTPKGDFVIDSKQRFAPWINPGAAWAASMPAVIPGGPDNPMGTTKIGINYSGVFMHGVPPGEFGSIGTHASHGCMRMMPSAVLDLYHRVNIGDPVYIRN